MTEEPLSIDSAQMTFQELAGNAEVSPYSSALLTRIVETSTSLEAFDSIFTYESICSEPEPEAKPSDDAISSEHNKTLDEWRGEIGCFLIVAPILALLVWWMWWTNNRDVVIAILAFGLGPLTFFALLSYLQLNREAAIPTGRTRGRGRKPVARSIPHKPENKVLGWFDHRRKTRARRKEAARFTLIKGLIYREIQKAVCSKDKTYEFEVKQFNSNGRLLVGTIAGYVAGAIGIGHGTVAILVGAVIVMTCKVGKNVFCEFAKKVEQSASPRR